MSNFVLFGLVWVVVSLPASVLISGALHVGNHADAAEAAEPLDLRSSGGSVSDARSGGHGGPASSRTARSAAF